MTTPHRLPGPPPPTTATVHPDAGRAGLFTEPARTDADRLADCIQWWDAATVAVWHLIAEGHPFDAYAITERVGRPYPGDARRVASFITRHHRAGNIRHAGYRRTRRPTSGAAVAVWEPTAQGRRAARAILPDDGDQGAEGDHR
jgi:hypothetical protein